MARHQTLEPMMTPKSIAMALAAAAAIGSAQAQPATPAQRAGVPADPSFGTMHFRSNVGSFKMIDGQGRVTIDFQGTMLISRHEGPAPTIEGNLRVEYDNRDRGKRVLFGTGRVTLVGKWRAVQVFGRGLGAVWFGRGVVRLSGEFDRNLETGWYWYDDPADRNPWPSQGTADFYLPPLRPGGNVTPRARDEVRPQTPPANPPRSR